MTQQLQNAIDKASRIKMTVKLLGSRSYLVVTPQAHKYTVRFQMHRGERYGVCNCKAGAANVFCYHLIPAALTDTAIQNMRGY